MKNSFEKVAALALAVLMLLMVVPASLASDGESVSNSVVPGLSDGGTLLTSLKKYSGMFEKLMAEEDPSVFADLVAQYMQDADFLAWMESSIANGTLSSDRVDALDTKMVSGLDGLAGTDTLDISGPTTVEVGGSISLTGSQGSSLDPQHTWTSSDTAVATVNGNSRYATVKGVAEGAVTITHTYTTFSISEWEYVQKTETYKVNVTARSHGEEALVFYLKTPTSNPSSNNTSEWGNALATHGTVNTTGATWVNDKNVFYPAPYITSMPGTAQGDGSYLLPKEGNASHYQAIFNAYKSKLESDLGIDLTSVDDIEAVYLTPYKISKNNGSTPDKHIDCTISVKCKNTFLARFWVVNPGQNPALVDSKNYFVNEKITKTEKAPTGDNGEYPNEINVGGVVYVFDGWYNEATQKVAEWPYTPSPEELNDGSVDFVARYTPKATKVFVTKSVNSSVAGDVTRNFSFTYQIDDEELVSFTLKNGTIKEIAVDNGSKIVVTEKEESLFNTTYQVDSDTATSGNTATIDRVESSGQTIAFTNTRKMATLKVKKEVTGETNSSTQFPFTVSYQLNETDEPVEAATFTLGNGQTSEGFTVPVGAALIITETGADNYNTSAMYGNENGIVNADGGTRRITGFTAVNTDGTITVINTIKTGKLVVKKNVTGGWGDKGKFYWFIYQYGNITNRFSLSDFGKTNVSFTVSDDLPYGTVVTITEDNYSSDDYTTTNDYDQNGRTATVTIDAAETTVTFTNHKEAQPDTGVLLDSLPYILILAAIAVIVGVVVVRKRHSRDDD